MGDGGDARIQSLNIFEICILRGKKEVVNEKLKWNKLQF